jgi:hypothetical protein
MKDIQPTEVELVERHIRGAIELAVREFEERLSFRQLIVQVPPRHGMSNATLASPKWCPNAR